MELKRKQMIAAALLLFALAAAALGGYWVGRNESSELLNVAYHIIRENPPPQAAPGQE